MLQKTLGFLGFGNMGCAMAGGLLEKSTVSTRYVMVYDLDAGKLENAQRIGLGVAESAEALARASDALILAVKPQGVLEAIEAIRPGLRPETLVITILAGVSTGFIQQQLGPEFRVARAMPNTPALVGAGAAGLALSANCTEDDMAMARTIFQSIGTVEVVPESAMDAVTALSGSGPAYFFYMVECMVAAAEREGLPRDQAVRLAGQTLMGAGRLLAESGEQPSVLRERVTSKGGTTEAALRAFAEHGFAETVATGVQAAAARSRELGR